MNEANSAGEGSTRLLHEGRVLQALRRHPEASQPTLARETGLARGTVVSIVRKLEERNFVVTKKGSSGPDGGRPGKIVRLCEDAGFALAVHFGHRHVRVACGNLRGYRIYFFDEESVEPAIEAEVNVGANEQRSLDTAVELIELAIAKGKENLDDLVAVTIGWPAPVRDPFAGDVVIDGSMRQWQGIGRPADKLKELLGWEEVPFLTENDAHLGALLEIEHGVGRESGDFLYVHWNSGIGGAVVSDGQVRRGGTGLGGEIGHIVLTDEAPADRPCRRCGSDRCLEVLAGGTAMVERLRERDAASEAEDLRQVFAVAERGGSQGELARSILAEGARLIGKALGPLVTVMNPTAIVFGGHLGRGKKQPNYFDLVAAAFRHSLRQHAAARELDAVVLINSSEWHYGAAQGGVIFGLRNELPEFVENRGSGSRQTRSIRRQKGPADTHHDGDRTRAARRRAVLSP